MERTRTDVETIMEFRKCVAEIKCFKLAVKLGKTG